MSREARLTETFVQLADTLVAEFDIVELLTTLADRCVEVLDVSAAGLMLVAPDGDLRVVARRARRCGWWSCSSCRPRKVRASTATGRDARW